ncbi:hypothetical protein B0H11DRAFT_2077068 [Mycena galericulata]|nr:hypothetical protein B0H11DRAFT_2077068 [Mycena galericulata]
MRADSSLLILLILVQPDTSVSLSATPLCLPMTLYLSSAARVARHQFASLIHVSSMYIPFPFPLPAADALPKSSIQSLPRIESASSPAGSVPRSVHHPHGRPGKHAS